MFFYLYRRNIFINKVIFNPSEKKPKYDKYNGDIVNEKIKFPEVRLIGPDGEQLGTMSKRDALKKAEEYDLDLLCVAPNGKPPVCKIINYGKYRFEQQKKEKLNRKTSKAKIIKTKEVQLTPQIGEHDLLTKVKNAIKFLEDGDKLKICLRFKGRQMAHIEVGEAVLNKFLDYVADYGTCEKKPSLEGRTLTCIVNSKTKK